MAETKTMARNEALSALLTCPICSRIRRNSVTIGECLHSCLSRRYLSLTQICWKCIAKKIRDEGLNRCPICHTYLGFNPVQNLRPDNNTRGFVTKIFSSFRNKTKKPDVSEGENNETGSEPRPQGIVLRSPPSTNNKEKPNSSKGKGKRRGKEGESISNCIIIDDDDEEEEEEYIPAPSPPVSVQQKKKPRGRPKKAVPASEGVGVSAQALVDANARETRLNSIWLSLVATHEGDAGSPLPQISPNYLRIRNIHAKASLLKKHIVRKLNLESEDEVEIEMRRLPLCLSIADDMEMWQLREWWGQVVASSEKISTTVGSSAKEFMMVISYSRKE